MLARHTLPENFRDWNTAWGVPFGYRVPGRRAVEYRLEEEDPLRYGPFGFQQTSPTREFEYPWAFFTAGVESGMKVLDVGGGLSGFQFVLDKEGCEVVNVDPSAKEDRRWSTVDGRNRWLTEDNHAELNKLFGTDVRLVMDTVQAGLADGQLEKGTFDRIFCLSVIEHVSLEEGRAMLDSIAELLKPGGRLLLTVDLFLDVLPFGVREANFWGSNIDVHELLKGHGLELEQGDPRELLGFPEFDYDHVVKTIPELFIGTFNPCLSQAMVLRKP